MIKKKLVVMFAAFPFKQADHPEQKLWLLRTSAQCAADERIERVEHWYGDDTPITMVRNRCVLDAIKKGVDVLVMLDNDNVPHKNFFWSTFEFVYAEYDSLPVVVAAPYCGPPPHENVYIFQWESLTSDDPDGAARFTLEQYSRERAALMTGIKPVASAPTGCIMIDMRVFTGFSGHSKMPVGSQLKLPLPWFYYEYTDASHSAKKSTEDIVFSRNLAALFQTAIEEDVLFCNWDAWARHDKIKGVRKPERTIPINIMTSLKRYINQVGDLSAIIEETDLMETD